MNDGDDEVTVHSFALKSVLEIREKERSVNAELSRKAVFLVDNAVVMCEEKKEITKYSKQSCLDVHPITLGVGFISEGRR